jgi:RNA polymerase sigma-70 factor (ECF subfamily)
MTTPTWPGGGAPASIVRAFKEAWEARNIDALIGLLDPDATATADTGGLVTALPGPIEGSEQVARASMLPGSRLT